MIRKALIWSFLFLITRASIASGEVILPITFKTSSDKGSKFVGSGSLIRYKSTNYLLTSVPVRKSLQTDSRCFIHSKSLVISNKSVAEIVDDSVGWKGDEDGFISVIKVSKKNDEVLKDLLQDFDPNFDSNEFLKINNTVHAKAFPTFDQEEPMDCTIPLTVVSGETYVRRNGVDYRGVLVYPSFPLCSGSCVYSRGLNERPIGIISNALPHAEKAFSGFAVLVRIENLFSLLK
jgi:hypothetical protein